MKIRRFFASSLAVLPKKEVLKRKVATTALLTAVMAIGTSFYAVKLHTPAGQTEASLAGASSATAVAVIPARGLSRQRADFEKALDILADAAGDMAFQMNPAIEHWVNYYTTTQGGRRTMTIGITRSGNFLDMARQEFRRAGVPEDLIWLAHVESVWNPSAVSPAAAGGIWQFIPKTAKEYGMTVESGNDERGDPLKQTRVAATYLRDLYTLFGDWALAMAAYNSGKPRVMDAIRKN